LRINFWEKKAQTQKGQKRFESRKTGIDAEPPHNKKQGMQSEVLYGWRTLGLGALWNLKKIPRTKVPEIL
jgi:hypothetical protein